MTKPRKYSFEFRPDIQGLRGLAVLLVVFYHAGLPVTGGFIGVDVFFVISGFVITGGLLKNLSRQKFSFQSFYARRIRRLLPALSLVLTAVIVGAIFFGPEVSLRRTGRTGVAAVFLNANHYLYLGGSYFDSLAEYNPLLHTWSLSVEEQFYLIFPAFIFIMWGTLGRKVGRLWAVGSGIALTMAVSFALSIWMTYTVDFFGFNGPRLAFFSSVTRSWEFGLGALLAAIAPWLRNRTRGFELLGWIGLIAVIAGGLFFPRDILFPGWAALVPAVGTALMILPGFRTKSWFARAFSWKPLTRIGDLSYSWYLWHWPLIVFAAATFPSHPERASLLAVVASLGFAWLTENRVENPIRYRDDEARWATWKVAAVCVVVPLSAWGLQVGAKAWTSQVTLLNDLRRLEVEYMNIGCDSTKTLHDVDSSCTWGEGEWDALLVGDSNARQHIPGLRELVPALNGRLRATTLSACPFTDLRPVKDGVVNRKCEDWVRRSLDAIDAHSPDVVIMSSSWDTYVTRPDVAFMHDGKLITDHKEREAAIKTSLTRIIERLREAGSTVLLVNASPKFQHSRPFRHLDRHISAGGARCSLVALLAWPEECNIRRDRAVADHWLDPTTSSRIHDVSQDGVSVVDLRKALCDQSTCNVLDDGVWLYRDAGHISPRGSRLTKPLFEQAFEDFGLSRPDSRRFRSPP